MLIQQQGKSLKRVILPHSADLSHYEGYSNEFRQSDSTVIKEWKVKR